MASVTGFLDSVGYGMMHKNLPGDLSAVELSYMGPSTPVVPTVTDLLPARSPFPTGPSMKSSL